MQRLFKVIIALSMIAMLSIPTINVYAAPIYQSDGKYYPEGYIIVGENHTVNAAIAMAQKADAISSRISDVPNLFYKAVPGTSLSMSGNLFYVFEGIEPDERQIQSSKEYIYSDGAGNHGVGVEKIHIIMNSNPSIEHWNIISWHGEENAKSGKEMADYYVRSYSNWINYEFPQASVYIMSLPVTGGYYNDSFSNVYAFQEALKQSLNSFYIDCSQLYATLQNNYIGANILNDEAYQIIQADVLNKVRTKRIQSFSPSQIGFILCSECHAGLLTDSRLCYLADETLNTLVPKDNIVSLFSVSTVRPAFWGGGDIVTVDGNRYEAFSMINSVMMSHPQIKFWYIVYFAGTNDVRYQGLTDSLKYVEANIQKIESYDFYSEHTIALMTTPHIYGRGKSTFRLVDNYDDGELEIMKRLGYGNYCYDTRKELDVYINNGTLRKYEFPDYYYQYSGDGIHYYSRQMWTAAVQACDSIYLQTRGE